MNGDFELFDDVKVIKSVEPEYEFLVGHIGTVIDFEGEKIVVEFYCDEEWADSAWVCYPFELEKVDPL